MGENMFTGFVQALAARGVNSQKKNPGDYEDQDGLLVCGKCGHRKQTYVNLPTGEDSLFARTKVACQCRCELAAAEEERKADEARKEMDRIASLRRMSLMDTRFSEASFDSFVENKYNAKILRLARRYVDKFDELVKKNQGLLFWGDVGTGKSFTAACIANALLERGVPVVMTSFIKLLDIVSKTGSDAPILGQLEHAKLLIFDDLGAERNTQYALERVYNFIDSRYRSELPMLLTTNLTVHQMMNEQDTQYRRIYDRLLEVCYPVQFAGPSFRMKTANRRFEEMQALMADD